jgi:two-component system NarL family sensor kinase
LIIARRPSNPVGWLLYVIGLAFGGGIVASQYGLYALVTNPGALPAGLLAAWVGDSIGIVVLGLVPLLVLLFPDGKLPDRGWRPLVWTIIGTSVVLTVANSLLPYQLAGDPRMPLNPTGIHGAADALEAVTFPAAIMLLCTGLASLKALRLRYAQSRGVERQQFKWFLFGAIILILTLIVMTPFVWRGIFLPVVLGFGLFNGCIAIALLRYHLYDIDQLINRTLVYGLLRFMVSSPPCLVRSTPAWSWFLGSCSAPGWDEIRRAGQ